MTLLEMCRRHAPHDGLFEGAVEGLVLARFSHPRHPVCSVTKPCLGVVLQGTKEVSLGATSWLYGPSDYLLISADLPLSSYSVAATVEKPYLGLALLFEPTVILEVAAQAGFGKDQFEQEIPAVTVHQMTEQLSSALHRLVSLLDRPDDSAILGPLIHREIIYHLLKTPAAQALYRLGVGESQSCALAAVRWLRDHFDQPLRIEELAERLNVSPSSLHHQFKAVTSTSPLQYQKLLRLQEARRMLLSGEFGAADAGFRVGYSSPSQFSREYKRLFGIPPSGERPPALTAAF